MLGAELLEEEARERQIQQDALVQRLAQHAAEELQQRSRLAHEQPVSQVSSDCGTSAVDFARGEARKM